MNTDPLEHGAEDVERLALYLEMLLEELADEHLGKLSPTAAGVLTARMFADGVRAPASRVSR